MRLPIANAKAIPQAPQTEEEVAMERAYCDEIARGLLEYELNPLNFLRRMRQRRARGGVGAIGAHNSPSPYPRNVVL